MRGADEQPGSMFSYVSLEERVPQDHPLRAIRRITDRALERLSPRLGTLYINFGRPSIPPEKLLRALLLQALYTIRSERQLMEQLDYNLLFRWFVGLGIDDAVWVPTTFTKNRDRLRDGEMAQAFFDAVLIHAALMKVGVAAADAVMVGDTPYDIEAATRAGVRPIAFRCGGWSDAALDGAIAIYDGPWDLLARLDTSAIANPKTQFANPESQG